MTFFVKYLLIFILFQSLRSVLSVNLTQIHENYVGSDSRGFGSSCVLSSFNATIELIPSNKTFIGHTFRYISPETMIGKITKCEETIEHYYRYDYQTDDSSRIAMVSLGFEISNDLSVDLYVKYNEVLCDEGSDCWSGIGRRCHSDGVAELAANNCYKMIGKYSLGYIRRGSAYQCSHNSDQTLKDVIYDGERPLNRGSVLISLDYFRIDVTNSSDTFNPIKYCLKDWIFDMNIIISVSAVLLIILLLIVLKCIFDCGRDRKRIFELKKNRSHRKRSEKLGSEECNESIEIN